MIKPEQIAPFRKSSDDYDLTEHLKARFAHMRQERQPFYLTGAELDEILKWKLRGQYGRQQRRRAINTEELIKAITSIALTITHPDRDYELELRVNLLCALRGVGVPVASAVLALVYPEQYAVIDFRGWRQVFGEEKITFSIADYKRYLKRIRDLADTLGWPPQEVDLAIWEYDRFFQR
jgi:thermostable 8-oxoguanine DNA glycosylase